MNSTSPIRSCLWAGLTTLALAVGACGEEADPSKIPDEGGAASSGLDEAIRAAVLASALADDAMTVSSIELGQTVEGRLSPGDNQLDDGSYYDAWLFELGSTTDVEIGMNSAEVDSYLSLYAGERGSLGTHMGSDDNGGGRPHALLWVELPAGTYTIMANSLRAGEIGAYELAFAAVSSDEGTELLAGSISRGSLETSDSTFNDGSHYDEWNYSGQGGEGVTVTMVSDEVDSYLMAFLGSSVAGERLTTDNNGGGGRNAEFSLILPATGTYTFVANSFSGGETGRYQLSVESGGSASRTYTTGGPSNGKYALLVGIDDYPGIGSDLYGPVEDARIMYRTLTERFGFDPGNIVVLNDSDATRENIANGVIQHLGQAGPEGVAVLFYSGHGMQMGENIGLTGALDPEPRGNGDEAIFIYGHGPESSVLLDEELGFLIETIEAGRALVVVDACFSGEITRGSADGPQPKMVDINDPEVAANLRLPTNFIGAELKAAGGLSDMSLFFNDLASIERVFQQPQRHIMWGASTEDQVSWTSGLGGGASVFTYFVGEYLMSAPLTATFDDISASVHDAAIEYTRANDMSDQDAQMRGDNARMTLGEFFGIQ